MSKTREQKREDRKYIKKKETLRNIQTKVMRKQKSKK